MTTTRRFAASLASLTAALLLFAANPAAAGLTERAETVTSGETATPAPQAAPIRTAALPAVATETTGSAEPPATVKRAAPTAAKPPVSRRAARAKKEFHRRPAAAFASARYAAAPVPSYGANCHRR